MHTPAMLVLAELFVMVCRQLLNTGKDIYLYSAALAPLPGSRAGGSGNCSAMLNLSKDKLTVKVYLFGQSQTTGISLKRVSASNRGAGIALKLVLQQVRAAESAGRYASVGTEMATRVFLRQVVAQLTWSQLCEGADLECSTCGHLGVLGCDTVRDLQL